jgi:hypothetical protein
MSGSKFPAALIGVGVARPALVSALCVSLFLPRPGVAESAGGANNATGGLKVMVTIVPVFRVLQVTAGANGYEYRIWTNIKSVVINGREYRFSKVGETTLTLPASSNDAFIVDGF